jgi:hypothetical protein
MTAAHKGAALRILKTETENSELSLGASVAPGVALEIFNFKPEALHSAAHKGATLRILKPETQNPELGTRNCLDASASPGAAPSRSA